MPTARDAAPTPLNAPYQRVCHTVFAAKDPQDFELLLQDGFHVVCEANCSIREFLCVQMGVCGDYTQIRVQTIFRNGHVVDDLDTAIVQPGDQLAFSAAMPGVVGATMRRGGYYASMRQGVTLETDPDAETKEGPPCFVRVRLFNFLARELARIFLRQGVYVPVDKFHAFCASQKPAFFQRLDDVTVDDKPTTAVRLCEIVAATGCEAVKLQER